MWTKQWPTEPGFYWFYGWPFRDREHKPELHFVDVWKVINGITFVTQGFFLYKEEGADGYWMPAELPELPEMEEDK